MYGNPETTTGGRALKFYASVRLDVRKIDSLKQGGEQIGNRTRIRVVKNKVAPPFREAEFDIMFGQGISREGDILDLAARYNVINKAGAWYSYNGEKIGQGRENAKQYLIEHQDVWNEVEKQVRTHYEAAAADGDGQEKADKKQNSETADEAASGAQTANEALMEES